MSNYVTYMHLLTALHTGSSSNEGNLMGIAREVHTEFPYLPASGVRGKNRAELESLYPGEASIFFGQKIKDGQQPTEGEVWFADATLLFFPIASLSHHLVWISCPLWLERWNRWLNGSPLQGFVKESRKVLSGNKSAVITFDSDRLYLQTALLEKEDLEVVDASVLDKLLQPLSANSAMIYEIAKKLVILTDEDCIALVETGLLREVRVALEDNSKTVKGGSFRSEEAIPPESVLFFPWGLKKAKEPEKTANVRDALQRLLNERLQFGGLEGLGRGWADLTTILQKDG